MEEVYTLKRVYFSLKLPQGRLLETRIGCGFPATIWPRQINALAALSPRGEPPLIKLLKSILSMPFF